MKLSESGLPFDDIRDLVAGFPGPDVNARDAAAARQAVLTKPPGSLGRLEEIALFMAAWQGREKPEVARPLVAVFAANHGIAERGVSAFPQSVTKAMVANFAAGGAAINQLCTANGLGLKVFELALEQPTPDIVEMDAFDEKACAATIAYGMEAVAGGIDLSLPRRDGDRQYDGRGRDLPRALRRRRGRLGRARHRRRRRGPEAQGGGGLRCRRAHRVEPRPA